MNSANGPSGSRVLARMRPSSTISACSGCSTGTVMPRAISSGTPIMPPITSYSSVVIGPFHSPPKMKVGWAPMTIAMGMSSPRSSARCA